MDLLRDYNHVLLLYVLTDYTTTHIDLLHSYMLRQYCATQLQATAIWCYSTATSYSYMVLFHSYMLQLNGLFHAKLPRMRYILPQPPLLILMWTIFKKKNTIFFIDLNQEIYFYNYLWVSYHFLGPAQFAFLSISGHL